MAKLTSKQQKFVEAYSGNATEAAIAAGYAPNSARITASKLLTNPNIVAMIKNREKEPQALRILTRQERQNLWTRIALGEVDGADMKDRLKATELLGRSEADFTDTLKVGLPGVIIKDLTGK